jgi:phenylalanyl-tRNA synthetase beta chain
MVLGGIIAHADAHFSEIHSCLDTLFYYVNQAYSLEPIQHPSFLAGRVGEIMSEGKRVGVIGELHPEVLERWQIGVPAVAFEVELTQLAEQA